MAGQVINKSLGDRINITNVVTKDASGNPCQGINYALKFVSGDPTGLGFAPTGLNSPYITCEKVGSYQVQLTSTNGGGVISTDAAGDVATPDTINVVVPPPASQTFQYV